MITARELSRVRTSSDNGFPPNSEPPKDFEGGHRWENHKDRHQQRKEAWENGQLFRLMGLFAIAAATEPAVRLHARMQARNSEDHSYQASRRLHLVRNRAKVDRFTQNHEKFTAASGIGTIILLAATASMIF